MMRLSFHLPLLTLMAAPTALLAQSGSYWQQEVHYEIDASVDDGSGVLSGRVQVTYINRSPDTLDRIYFHQYLNAFRPGSRWADADSVANNRRYNDLQEPDFAYERLTRASVGGRTVTPFYPYAPDSTIVGLMLPRDLGPGDTLTVDLAWNARPSTTPRRQGRRGRRLDFAQWYPRVAVYDRFGWQPHPLYPAGEFYGEFGTYDVTLDLPADQVIGSTGVPIEGDPGWQGARRDPGQAVDYQRNWYRSRSQSQQARGLRGQGSKCGRAANGRKCVRFYAEDVHHFAFSLNPEYVYEQGAFEDVVVRVLYLPGDTQSWGNGVAVQRTETALSWLDTIFGDFTWPQITNLHRIDGGGTEFPMMMHNGSSSQGLIMHEGAHNYVMGILANNEWKEGFLDEGFASFVTTWFFEENFNGFNSYPGIEQFILNLDLEGWSQPVSFVSEDYRDFTTYNLMIYTRAELFYHQLREIVGHETMRAVLREYYRRWQLKHVSEEKLLDVVEDVSGQDLSQFFAQWLHGSGVLYDYGIDGVDRRRLADGTWETTVRVKREGEGIYPVEIGELRDGEPVVHGTATGRPLNERVVLRTDEPVGQVVLDPRVRSHDWNFTNNYERKLFGGSGQRFRLDNFIEEPSDRNRTVHSLAPTVWYNDAAGLVLGGRARSNYLGRFNIADLWVHRGVGIEDEGTGSNNGGLDFYVRLANPTSMHKPGVTRSLEFWDNEGTSGARLSTVTTDRSSFAASQYLERRSSVEWVAASELDFLDLSRWENAGTVEFRSGLTWHDPRGATDWELAADVGLGLVYGIEGQGVRYDRRFDTEGYGRLEATATVERPLGSGLQVRARAYVGGYLAESAPPAQRTIQVAGADPYATLRNPFVRTRGALFVRPDVYYHSPGGSNLRGYLPGLGGRWSGSLTVELEKAIVTSRTGFVRSARLAAFGDGAVVDSMAVPSSSGADVAVPLFDAGLGVRFDLQVRSFNFPVRVDLPLMVSRPEFAFDNDPGTEKLAFRWLFSLQQTF